MRNGRAYSGSWHSSVLQGEWGWGFYIGQKLRNHCTGAGAQGREWVMPLPSPHFPLPFYAHGCYAGPLPLRLFSLLFNLKNIFSFLFWLRWVFVAVRGLFSSCGKRGLLLIAVHGLLIAVASLVVKHGL